MFDPILGYSAGTYEAIIAAFIVIGLIQTLVLRRKANQLTHAKKAFLSVVALSTAALLQSGAEVSKWRRRALAAQREAMVAAADRDDNANDRSGGFSTRRPPVSIDELLSSLSPTGRNPNRDPFDAIFGGRRSRFHPSRFDPQTNNRAPGEPDTLFSGGGDFTLADIKKALSGDLSSMERAVGADPGSLVVEVLDGNMRPISPEKRAEVLSAINDGSAHIGHVGTATDLGAALHREIDAANEEAARHFGPESGKTDPYAVKTDPYANDPYAAIAEAVRKPVDSSAWTGRGQPAEELRKADVTAQPHETAQAEACGTQVPSRTVPRFTDDPPFERVTDKDDRRGFYSSNPRAG